MTDSDAGKSSLRGVRMLGWKLWSEPGMLGKGWPAGDHRLLPVVLYNGQRKVHKDAWESLRLYRWTPKPLLL